MSYCFFGSSIKFQGHKGWKIDDLNPIWVRLLGRSQLSNPSDLPCSQKFHRCKKRVGLDGSKESNIRRPLLSNLTCFHVLHDVHPRYPQFSWCGRYCHVLTYLNNTMLMHQWFNKLTDLGILNILMLGICHSHDWNLWWQFGESRGTIFCELCGNPVITSIMMCGMMWFIQVQCSNVKIESENRVW